ncbi:plasmid partitioning protein RepB C-terminal domain-containing protein [Pseudomonas sp. H3_E04]
MGIEIFLYCSLKHFWLPHLQTSWQYREKNQPDQQISAESIARLERELAALQMQIKTVEEDYGPDVLHLTVIKGYLAKLLANAAVVRWLARHQPEFLKEFQSIAELTELPWGIHESDAAQLEPAVEAQE